MFYFARNHGLIFKKTSVNKQLYIDIKNFHYEKIENEENKTN